jgi:hypothetical protein
MRNSEEACVIFVSKYNFLYAAQEKYSGGLFRSKNQDTLNVTIKTKKRGVSENEMQISLCGDAIHSIASFRLSESVSLEWLSGTGEHKTDPCLNCL